MNDQRKKEVLTWMYQQLSHKWFSPYVLDPIHNKAGNPPCNLSQTEIHSVFETLRKEEYIFPVINQHGYPCFILNEMKESEWIERIDNTSPTKEKMVGDFVKKGFVDFFKQIVAGISGGVVTIIVAKILGILK